LQAIWGSPHRIGPTLILRTSIVCDISEMVIWCFLGAPRSRS